jgi:NADH-quinone oxidoreductase subunit L
MMHFSLQHPLFLILPIALPFFAALFLLILPPKLKILKFIIAFLVTLLNLILTALLFKYNFTYTLHWLNFGLDFSLRIYAFSAFMILAASTFGLLITLYSTAFMAKSAHPTQFFSYLLITLAFANGVFLADNLLLLLFFWEGLLLVLFAMIAIGNQGAFKAAAKAFIITGVCDLCMLLGVALCGYLANTFVISKMHIAANGLGALAFLLLVIGAISKGGSMPFHSWIPDAALVSPLPFMALVPAALEKLLGIYFLTRISLDIFKLSANSRLSIVLMWVGSLTAVLAVMMALIQKNYKRLLSYHAISQVGYMILGIGTSLPAGIIGGLFHMVNNAIYKSGLFLTAGAVEKQSNTSELTSLGGLGRKMPITFLCFVITAASISGVPPFNGFFSKELVYDAALNRGLVFYLAALVGSFFTAASFLKLGHAAFLGKLSSQNEKVKEAKWQMCLPMIILSGLCILFGLASNLAVNKLIIPSVKDSLSGLSQNHVFHPDLKLVIASVMVLILAFLNHILGVRFNKGAVQACDHFRYAPILSWIYERAEKRFFDPYDIGLKIAQFVSKITFGIDRAVDWVYEVFSVRLSLAGGSILRRLHAASYPVYLTWCLAGFIAIIAYFIYLPK